MSKYGVFVTLVKYIEVEHAEDRREARATGILAATTGHVTTDDIDAVEVVELDEVGE